MNAALRYWTPAAVMILAATSTSAPAQTTVYQCKTAQGMVFSGQPCASPGKNMKVLELKAPAAPDPAEVARRAGVREQAEEDSWQLALARQESQCIENHAAATRRGTERRVNEFQAQINYLRRAMGYTSEDLSRATWSTGISEQIAALQNAISNEKQILAQTELNARSVCAQKRMAAAEAHNRP